MSRPNIVHKVTFDIFTSVGITNWESDPNYMECPDISVLYDLSTSTEIVPRKYWKIDGANIVEMTSEEKEAVDLLGLSETKRLKKDAIDQRTGELIAEGFTYDGCLFSTSNEGQHNWMALLQAADKNMLSFPMPVSTIDDSIEYIVQNSASLAALYGAGLAAIKTHWDSGREIKETNTGMYYGCTGGGNSR